MRKIIRNIRYGLATNSSSSHSIIHNPGISTHRDKEVDGDYQWNFFTLVSKEAKTSYMMAQLASNLPYDGIQASGYIMKELGYSEAGTVLTELSVDHESVLHFPRDTYNSINMEFFMEYKDFLVEGDFAFLGGNDNTDEEHELMYLDTKQETYNNFLNSRDTSAYKNGNYWVLTSPKVKHRICFTDETLAPTKPELIDIKITDFCDIGCSFCYQDSTTEGKHANIQDIKKIAGVSNSYKTMTEFAIGGGEPTQHPEFAEILKILKGGSRENQVAFTTKNKEWFTEGAIVQAVREYCSGVAYSCTTKDDVLRFYQLHRDAGLFDNKSTDSTRYSTRVQFYVHLIPELIGPDNFRSIMAFIDEINRGYSGKDIHVTCLGYKPIGRANKEYNIIPEFVDIIIKLQYTEVGIDTKFAKDYQQLLDDVGISRDLYTTEEGQFSAYIDAVQKIAYKSSWQLNNPVQLTFSNSRGIQQYKGIKEIFEDIQIDVPRDGMHAEPQEINYG